MKNYANLFEYTAQPADSQRILEFESKLGKKLPDDYKMLLSETGGGILNLEKCFLTDISLPDGDTLEVVVEDIFGNGTASNGAHVDLIDYATFLMDEWEIPEEVLLLAASEDGMHQCFVINYGLPDFPEGAVLYVDTDPDGIIMPVAESVDAFLSKLGPYPDQEETVEDAEPDNIG
ncbi:SMI1/KNR4 family protein, partial [Corynebacterium parakroppenstedtii]